MQKVEMLVGGRRALVDADMVKKMTKKQELVAAAGMNVAAVFKEVPFTYMGRPVINGDETDLRFLDPKGVIVGLKAKGKAKKDTTGFVI